MKSLDDFLKDFELEEEYEAWLALREQRLSEDVFLESLQGVNGNSADLLTAHEKFWISFTGHFVPPEDDTVQLSQYALLINKLIFPVDIFFEKSQQHMSSFIPESAQILMKSDKGFLIKGISDGYKDPIGTISTDIVLTNNGLQLDTLDSKDRLYLPKGSVLTFWFAEPPTTESLVAATLVANKVKEIPIDMAILNKLSGAFYIHDSLEGDLLNIDGSLAAVTVRQMPFYSSSNIRFISEDVEIQPEWFYKAYTITQTGADNFDQDGIVSIKNNTPVTRVLTLKPLIDTPIFYRKGKVTIDNPPQNVKVEGDTVIITLDGNQGILGG